MNNYNPYPNNPNPFPNSSNPYPNNPNSNPNNPSPYPNNPNPFPNSSNPYPNNPNPYPNTTNPYPNNPNPNPNNPNPNPNNPNPYPNSLNPNPNNYKPPSQQTWFYIQNISSGLVLDIKANNHQEGAEVMAHPYNGQNNQLFRYDTSTQMIYSKLNGFVLDVDPDQRIILYKPHGGSNQQWRFDTDNTIRSHTGNVLDIATKQRMFGGDTKELVAYQKHGGPNQQFRVVYV